MEKKNLIWRKIGLGAIAGIAIGTTLELVFSAFRGSVYLPGTPEYLAKFQNQIVAVGLERLNYAVLGIILLFAASLYDKENISLLKASVLHLLVIFTSLSLTAYLMAWVPTKPLPYLGFLLITLTVYAIIWCTIWLSIYKKIKKINQKIGSGTEK